MSLPDLPKFLELLPFLHHHTQFARIASFLRHQKNSDLEGYYPSIRVVEYLILKFRNSKSFNQGGGMYAVKKVELQRLVVLAKSPVNLPGKVFTTVDGEKIRNTPNANTGNDTRQ